MNGVMQRNQAASSPKSGARFHTATNRQSNAASTAKYGIDFVDRSPVAASRPQPAARTVCLAACGRVSNPCPASTCPTCRFTKTRQSRRASMHSRTRKETKFTCPRPRPTPASRSLARRSTAPGTRKGDHADGGRAAQRRSRTGDRGRRNGGKGCADEPRNPRRQWQGRNRYSP